MIARSFWMPVLYGGLAGVVLGLLRMIAGLTSRHPSFCALQVALIVAVGFCGGLIVGYGPRRTLARVLGMRPGATLVDLGRRLALLLILTSLSVTWLTADWKPTFRLLILLVAWIIVLLILIDAGLPRAGDPPRRRWGLGCCDALAAAYGPFIIAAVNTWLTDGSNTWLRVDLVGKFLLVAPAATLIELTSLTIWHQRAGLSPIFGFLFAGLLSATMVTVGAWVMATTRRMRWVVLPIIGSLCAYGALFLDAAMRM